MAYSKGKISIPNVSGNIVIAVTTIAKAAVNLFVKTPSVQTTSTAVTPADNVYLGGRLNSSHNVVLWNNNQLITRPIAVAVGDVITVTTDADNKADSYKGSAAFYDASNNFIAEARSNDGWSWIVFGTGNLTATYTIPASIGSASLSNAAYARFTVAYTDIDNIVITKA